MGGCAEGCTLLVFSLASRALALISDKLGLFEEKKHNFAPYK
jgi:hypothetical protein